MEETNEDKAWNEEWACVKAGLTGNKNNSMNHYSCCPNWGSSDCPMSPGFEDIECQTDYDDLMYTLSFRGKSPRP